MKSCSVFIMFLIFLGGCRQNTRNHNETNQASYEAFRPQYHFTPQTAWMNDPNGMVYYEGEYHLFYQYYPDSTVWGPMHWGHAVSQDLIHWQSLPVALYPDRLGYIFSGSAVIDWKNTSGLGTAQDPPMVAIYTYHDPEGERAGRSDFQTQGIAYSVDKGRTWIKYDKNPVLTNPGIRDFRDPKVSWNEVSNLWVMTLAVKDHIEFYSSPDLKNWSKLSEFGNTIGAHGGVWECPDLFSLKDEDGNSKWVLLVSINPGGPQGGSATQYFIGDFDGRNFLPQDTVTRWIDYGADNYAGVTWSDIPSRDGRRLFIGWMSNWQYANVVPTVVWRSATTLPREVVLDKKSSHWELNFKPVKELAMIQQKPVSHTGTAALNNPLCMIEFDVEESSREFSITLSNDLNEKVTISFSQGAFLFDRTVSGITGFNVDFPSVHEVDVKNLVIRKMKIYVDLSSVEIFINDGERVVTEVVFPRNPYDQITLHKKNPRFTVSTIASTWN